MAAVAGLVAMVLVPQALAGTFTVTTNADSGGGSLRQAILDANAAAGSDTITFAVGTGLQRITLASPLPAITQPVVLDATTQRSVTAPGIVLDGSSCATCADGLVVTGGGSTIKGLAVVGFDGRGVVFDGTQTGAGGNTLETSAVGWDPETSFFKNNGAAGVAILSSPNNTIGGSAAAKVVVAGDGNSAAGDDQTEILITGTASSGNVVSGNWIGLGADGTSSPDTANGVVVTAGAHDNTIGGAASAGNTFFVFYQDAIDIRSAGSGNVVAGNSIGIDDEGTVGSSHTGIGVEDSPGTTIGDSAVPPGFADTTRGNVVAGATGDVGVFVSGSSDGTRIVGNFIGTDRQGAGGLGNDQGVRVLDASGITIGPGNTITANISDGIEIAGGSGNRIVANSIFGNAADVSTAKGIRLDPGANGDIVPPVLTDAASASGTTTGHGTFQGTSPNEQVFVELFAGSSCDPRGGGERYLGSVTATGNANGFASFSFSVPTTAGDTVLTATATDTTSSSTSEFSNCTTVDGAPAASGTLTTDLTPNPPVTSNVDVSAGSLDWAVWGSSTGSLTPDVRKAGGTAISDLTLTNGGTTSSFAGDPGNPWTLAWSGGAPTGTATAAKAGLQLPKDPTTGVSFTVPADTTERTLTVWTSVHFATATLSASLSDQSSAPISVDFTAGAGAPGPIENEAGIFTINYSAASAGQTLTVTLTESATGCGTGPGSCDDVILYAAALAGAGNATSVSTTLKPDASVEISGSNDPVADLPLSAFAPQQPGVTPSPINGLPLNGLPLNGLPLNGLPLNGLPLNGLPLNGLPLNGLPLNGLPLNGLPLNGLPLNGLPLNGLSWETLLAGTPLAGLPLQTVTLQQVLSLSSPPPAIQTLKLGDLQLDGSNLGKLTIGALALGSTPLNGLGAQATSIETQLQQWCEGVATDQSACSLTNIGNQSLFALGLAGAPLNGLPLNGLPLNGLPLNGLPLNGLPLNGLDLSASPLNGLPLNGLPLNGLFTCDPCTGLTVGQAIAADDGNGKTVGDLLAVLLAPGSPYRSTITLGDVIAFLVDRDSVPWETLAPRLLSAFDPERPTLGLNTEFTVQGNGDVPVKVKVTLPDGFDYAEESATLTATGFDATHPEPDDVAGPTLTWTLPSVQTGTSYQLDFAVRSGTTVGPAQATLEVTSGAAKGSVTMPFRVTDSFPAAASIDSAPEITPGQNVEMSALAATGDVDYYKVALPPAGTRLQVHLTNLHADYDLALYANQSTSVRTGATDGVPLQDGTVADQQVNLQGGVNPQLTPTALQDVPDPGIPAVQVSSNRGTDDEDVGMVSPGAGFAYIAVFGYNGSSSPQPYTLRVTTRAPQAFSCMPRHFDHAGEGTAGTLPTLPANVNTLFLVAEKRLGETYGAPAESDVVAKLDALAGRSDLGVSGAVVPVESVAGAQAKYDAWDANPCSVDAANAVANTIANYVDTQKAAHASLKYVVFVGGDDQVPFFRIPDLSLIANETGFASDFADNEYFGALASGDLLTDNPYLDTRPVPASGRQLFIPDLVGGRLVEKPGQITAAVDRFADSQGTLQSSTAFVSGYDFVSDGSALVQSRLASTLGSGNVRTLIDDTWSKSDLFGAAFPTGGPADINDWNGHYDNHQALAANGDRSNLISTADSPAFDGGIFFTMGCHAGFQTTDAIVGAPVRDWAEYFAGTGTGFVGNTGFGIGNTDSVAFSEELMADLAGHLDGSLSIGEALTQAKRDYYLSRTAFGSYDEKTLSEAELYGLPMYGVGTSPAALAAAPLASPSPDPVTGTSSSTSPSEGTLAALAGTSAKVASFDAVPDFSGPQSGDHGQYYTNAGQVQAPNYRPLQPYVTLPATRAGTTAHGVLIDGLTSSDHTPFDPDNVRPTLDLSANEPEPQFADEAWPTKVPTLVTLSDTLGVDQSLNLATGQFFTDTASHDGVERLWTHISGRVVYSDSNDFDPPQIDSIDAFVSNGHVAFSGSFSDTGTGVKLAQVVYDVDNGGAWKSLPLQQQAGGSWTGGAAFSGAHVQFFVEACDDAGNCGFSSNKGRYFDAAPLPAGGGTITLAPSVPLPAGGFYTGALDVTVTSSNAEQVTVTLDGAEVTANPVPVSGDGVHILEAHGSDGASATGVYLIDSSPPSKPVVTGIVDGRTYPIADLPPASAIGCTALDAVSGATCEVTGYSSDYGQHTLTATATDGAGHSSTSQVTYVVGLKSGDILAPLAAKSGDQTDPNATDLSVSKIGSTLPVKFQMYLDGARTKLMTTPPSGSTARLTLVRVSSSTDSSSSEVVISSATSDSGGVFRWTGSPDFQYVYNQKTKSFSQGKYYVTITVSLGDVILASSEKQYFVLKS